MKPHTSAHSPGIAPGPHNGVGLVASESLCWELLPQEYWSDEGLSCIMARIVTFLGIIVVDVQRHDP